MPLWAIVLIVLGVGALAVAMPFGRALDLAKSRIGGASQVVASPFGPIEFASMGDGPVVLAVHGTGGGFDQGLSLGAPLAARGFRIVAPSRFGYLRSSLPKDHAPETQADAFAFLLRGLGIERVFVLAASAGAPSAMQFALRHKELVAALVLLVPLAHDPAPRSKTRNTGVLARVAVFLLLRSSFLFWLVLKLAPRVMIRSLLATDPALLKNAAPEEERRALAILRNIMPVAPRARGMKRDARLARRLAPYPLADIETSTLVISCEDDGFDTVGGARHTALGVRRGRFINYPTGGHIWVGRNDEVWAEIEAFLRAHAAPAAASALELARRESAEASRRFPRGSGREQARA